MLFNLDFASNTILSCFFFFYLISDLYLLILAVITRVFNPTAELVIHIDIPSKEGKEELETHPGTAVISCFNYIFHSEFLTYVFFRHDNIVFDTSLY